MPPALSFSLETASASQQPAGVDYGHAIREQLDFGERVRGEEQGSPATAQHLRFQEAAKFRGGDGVEAARGLVEKQDAGLVQNGAIQAEALDCAGGQRAHLAVERFTELKLFGEVARCAGAAADLASKFNWPKKSRFSRAVSRA